MFLINEGNLAVNIRSNCIMSFISFLLLSGFPVGGIAGLIALVVFIIVSFIILTILFFVIRYKSCNSHLVLQFIHHKSTESKGHMVSTNNKKSKVVQEPTYVNVDLPSKIVIRHSSSSVDDNDRDSFIETIANDDLDFDSKNSQPALV